MREPTLPAVRAGLTEIMMRNSDMASAKIELKAALAEARTLKQRSDHMLILAQPARPRVRRSEFAAAGRGQFRPSVTTTRGNNLPGLFIILFPGIASGILMCDQVEKQYAGTAGQCQDRPDRWTPVRGSPY